MILDGHVHLNHPSEDWQDLPERMRASGVDGGVVVSPPPSSFPYLGEPMPFEQRLGSV